jgi:hypothetical protein
MDMQTGLIYEGTPSEIREQEELLGRKLVKMTDEEIAEYESRTRLGKRLFLIEKRKNLTLRESVRFADFTATQRKSYVKQLRKRRDRSRKARRERRESK